ncbi:hypothetical protein M409DRAFT_26474 [Zasmidium cellare ATCC 36951]|uniref:DUF1665 domain-containing protein n=1 Tax=Zasmidium cellare ATCC 36951 TaxID=1080233 RepID=A0A6A6C768_ZASCE|nr:uncharacterized protein M409DRAFT_26474 [Zasmidium cellare ATCC 36951]KAF2163027.1 hypothetical protein M409DRAFT_26474 [Zasmidium cellare ATCC 36951]
MSEQWDALVARANAKREAQTIKPGELLGLDRPISGYPEHSFPEVDGSRPRFPNAIQDWNGTPLTLRERSMIAFMNEITDKPEWTRKVNDEEIVGKWRKEREDKEKETEPERALTEKMFDYCLLELRDYAEFLDENGFVPAIDAEAAVYKSDTIIPDAVKDELKAAAAPLEDVPAKDKDWHPGSDDKVLDLVHPSLFPLLYGRSRILKDGSVTLEDCEKFTGKGEIMPVPDDKHLEVTSFPGLSNWGGRFAGGKQHFFSKKFQWLPCEVKFGEDESCKISSYINNLHPKQHKPLYEAIEKVIAKTIPMWNKTLTSTERMNYPSRIDSDNAYWIDHDAEQDSKDDDDEDEDEDEDEDDEDEDERHRNRTLVMPEPDDYAVRKDYTYPDWNPAPSVVDLRKNWAKQGLQVIVKLANIHLTPEKPTYDGGSWHVEGQLNDHICASALYYYSTHNITPSHLSFREAISVEYLSDKSYEQDDHEHFERLYDIQQHGPAIQTLGRISTPENRLLTFPNILQHQVAPFQLADPTQPGHRKILALFLVDPHTRIPSSAHVPPQQKAWWREMVQSLDRVGDLPPELADAVVDSAGDFPIELEEAKKIREELMEERKLFVEDCEKRMQEESFNFCEH